VHDGANEQRCRHECSGSHVTERCQGAILTLDKVFAEDSWCSPTWRAGLWSRWRAHGRVPVTAYRLRALALERLRTAVDLPGYGGGVPDTSPDRSSACRLRIDLRPARKAPSSDRLPIVIDGPCYS
jgi:hypothetical protein